MTGWLVFKRQSLLQPQLYCLSNHDFFLSSIPSINPSLTSDNSNPLLPSSHPTLPLSKVKQLEWINVFWRGKGRWQQQRRGGNETKKARYEWAREWGLWYEGGRGGGLAWVGGAGGDGQRRDFKGERREMEKEIPASAFLCVSMGAAGEEEGREAGRIEGDNKWGDAGGEQRCNGGGEGRAGLWERDEGKGKQGWRKWMRENIALLLVWLN